MLNSPFPKPTLLPPDEHPRLMFRAKDAERIRENFSHPENARAFALWQRVLKKDFRNYYDDIKAGRYNMMVCIMIESQAFAAYMNDDAAAARQLIPTAIRILDLFSVDSNVNLMLCRHAGHLVYVISCMYDWLYGHLTPEEKTHIIHRCEEILASSMEMKYPPTGQRDITGHGHELQLLRDMLGFSIAVYDERPDIYEYCAGRIFHEHVPMLGTILQAGFHNQGAAYGAYRHAAILWCDLIFTAMCGQRAFAADIHKLADSYYYLTRGDGENFRIGDDCNDDKLGGITIQYPFAVTSFLAAALTGNEQYRQCYFDSYHDEFMLPSAHDLSFYKYGSYGEGMYTPVVHLIFHRLAEPFTPAPYEKARHFGYPNGVTVYRDEASGTGVYMKIGELWGVYHDHFDTGEFQIFHNGILASSSGAYYWFGNNHFWNYDTQTSSHNCLTVRDPAVKVVEKRNMWGKEIDVLNDGGTRRPSYSTPPVTVQDYLDGWERDFRMARVLSHTETEELVEIVGDLTEAYAHTCEKVIRSMRFEPKAGACGVFTVHDTVTAKSADFEKRFHIHTQSEPVVEGNKVTIEHKGGRLVCTVLKPENAVIRALGGGDMRWTLNDQPIECEKTDHREAGWGKIIISPADKQKEHEFLVVMEIQDAEL